MRTNSQNTQTFQYSTVSPGYWALNANQCQYALDIIQVCWSSSQVKLGWNDYLLAQLSLLCAYVEHNTKLPSTSTDTTVLAANQHTSSLPAQGNAASTEIPTQISGTTSTRRYLLPAHRGGGTLAPPTDRLPSFIQVASQIGEVSLAGLSTADIQSLLTSSHGGPLRELLSSTVKKLAENIPTGWKKVLWNFPASSSHLVHRNWLLGESNTYELD